LGSRGDNYDRFLLRIKEVFESFRLVLQSINLFAKHIDLDNNNSIPYILSTTAGSAACSSSSDVAINAELRRMALIDTIEGPSKKRNMLPNCLTGIYSSNHAPAFLHKTKFTGMEELIHHFRLYSSGAFVPAGMCYNSLESPKGELGVLLISDGTTKPFRLKIRTPVSHNMHAIPSVCIGSILGDFVMTFCSLDIVLGEIDR